MARKAVKIIPRYLSLTATYMPHLPHEAHAKLSRCGPPSYKIKTWAVENTSREYTGAPGPSLSVPGGVITVQTRPLLLLVAVMYKAGVASKAQGV